MSTHVAQMAELFVAGDRYVDEALDADALGGLDQRAVRKPQRA